MATRVGVSPVDIASALLDAGVGILQYRHKGIFTRDRFDEGASIAGLCESAGAKFVVNDRADIALLLGAGLHLGQDDLPFDEVRRIFPTGPIGYSTHNETQFADAPAGAAYVALGPIFATVSKENPDPVVGVAELRRLALLKRAPLIAIGGVTLEWAPQVWAAGADSIAVIGALIPESATGSTIRAEAGRWLAAASMV